jgi:hypothetical protein
MWLRSLRCRTLALVVLLGGSVGLNAPPALAKAPLTIGEAPGGRALGAVEVHASPTEVRDALLDFVRWPALFYDVTSAAVKSRTPTHTVVEVRSRSFKRPQKLRVRTDDPNRTPFELIDGRGVRVTGEFSFEPARPGVTRIRGQLQTEAKGVFGLIVRDRKLRSESRSKLQGYLEDLGKRFWRGP